MFSVWYKMVLATINFSTGYGKKEFLVTTADETSFHQKITEWSKVYAIYS